MASASGGSVSAPGAKPELKGLNEVALMRPVYRLGSERLNILARVQLAAASMQRITTAPPRCGLGLIREFGSSPGQTPPLLQPSESPHVATGLPEAP